MKFLLATLILLSATLLQSSAGSFNTVVIDAGHGGRDNGGSYGKVYEKWLALDTAMRVEKKLKAKGFKTVMTRRSDNFITLPVSIHYNFTWKRNVSGLETFYCSQRSKPLAAAVQSGMLGEVKSVNRGVKFARYYVIRHAQNPAILVEGGFVSNSKERGRTKEGWYREALANGIAKGISDYKNLRRRGTVH
jgi:N-acetylmuramoyl-L-alanine amidase